jgi:hypothetical protein
VVKLFTNDKNCENNKSEKLTKNTLTVTRGQMYFKLAVQILQSDGRTITWHLPNINDRYSVGALILEKGQVVKDLGSSHLLYSYDKKLSKDIATVPTDDNATNCYYSFYNFSMSKCGSYQLKLQLSVPVVGESQSRILECSGNHLLNINVVAPEVSRVNIIGQHRKQIKLGESLAPLTFNFCDKEKNVIVMDGAITASIDSNNFEVEFLRESSSIKSSIHLKPCNTENKEFVMDCSSWVLIPKRRNREDMINGKEFSFEIKISSSSYPDLPVVTTPKTIIFPGVPTSIVSLAQLPIKLNSEQKSMRLAIQDKWGNRVAPSSKELWHVQFLHGPLKLLDPKERISVDKNGEVLLMNKLVVTDGYEPKDLIAQQCIQLKSGHDVVEGTIPIKIIPSNIPRKLQVKTASYDVCIIDSPTFCLLDISR